LFNSEINPTTHNLIDSRKESTTTKATQESRILNYNPYSPYSPLSQDRDDIDRTFVSYPPPEEELITTPTPNVDDYRRKTAPTSIRKIPTSSRIRKSYYISKQTPTNQDTVVINNEGFAENCRIPHQRYHNGHCLPKPQYFNTQNHSPVVPVPVLLSHHHQNQNIQRFPSTLSSPIAFPTPPAQGAGYKHLDPILPPGPNYSKTFSPAPSRYLGPNNGFPSPNTKGFREGISTPIFPPNVHHHHHYSQQHENGFNKVSKTPTPVGYVNQGSVGSTSAAFFNGNSHGILVNDPDVINTGIVIPKNTNMESFEIPRYGYLIFNPKRGPPFYIIPAETSAFERRFGRSVL